MRLHFKINDYLLTWNLLFGASFSRPIHEFKQRLYKTHKRQYEIIQKDKKEMLSDIKNFIPDNDTLYNLVFETELFTRLKQDTERHRLELLKMWDQNKNTLNKELKNILGFNLRDDYNVLVLHPIMDSSLFEKGCCNIGWGFRTDLHDPYKTLTDITYFIVKNELAEYKKQYKDIVDAVLELSKSELYTRLSGNSNYKDGDKSLVFLKKQIYPFFLMYLGYELDDFPGLMMRDGITFDIDKYPVHEGLSKLNLLEFIDFCIQNQRSIINIKQLEIL